jgi:hypothetical protein
MGAIYTLTGSLEGTVLTGAFGSILALTDSQITVTGSGFEERFTLPKGNTFTDTGTALVNNSFTEIIAWGSGANLIVQSA